MRDQTEYNVRAVERALQILDCFDDNHPEMGVSDIAEQVGLHKATAHRILTTLLNFGYIERAAEGQRYRLGLKLIELGSQAIKRVDLRREALPSMRQLTEELDEACDLSILDKHELLYIEVLQSSHALTIAASVGMRLPIHCTASGKVFLAYMPPEDLAGLLTGPLTRHTPNTMTSPDQLLKELEVVRQLGYACDHEELEMGIMAVAVPIRNKDGKVLAAMSVPSPISRMNAAHIPVTGEALLRAAASISRRLGWTG